MTLEERAELAAARKQGQYNCCQAVLLALADQTGLTEEQLISMGSVFGAGMGDMEATCGALVGAGIAAGLAMGQSRCTPAARRLSACFRQKCGAERCRDLKGVGQSAPVCSCDACVRNAVLSYGETVGLQ